MDILRSFKFNYMGHNYFIATLHNYTTSYKHLFINNLALRILNKLKYFQRIFNYQLEMVKNHIIKKSPAAATVLAD
jgi:hypothetical protein